MSDTNPPSIPIALELDTNNPVYTPGTAVFPIAISNNDGTAPTLQPSGASPSTVVTAAVAPSAAGSAAPFTGTFTAASVGSTTYDLITDGVVDVVFVVTVTGTPPEGASVDPTLIVITPPGPAAAA
jgi:hypothetical protein